MQKKLDIIANDVLIEANEWGGHLAAMASEEMDSIHVVPNRYPQGEYLLMFDPLDGSSNIEVNVSIGTIFSVLKKVDPSKGVSEDDFLQPGTQQVAAGYCVYGPQTTLVLTVGDGVAMFTLDREQGSFVLTQENVKVPADTKEFAINMSNMRHWDEPVKRYIDECLQGEEGPRGKNFNMRWIASMVADVHRILTRGGVFMYPWDKREPGKAGKLRLIAVTTPKRLAQFPDVPTVGESVPGYEFYSWYGLWAPKGTPADVVTKINNALKAALKDPEFIKKEEALGAVVVNDKRTDPAEHKKFVAAEIAKWGPIIKAAGIYAD